MAQRTGSTMNIFYSYGGTGMQGSLQVNKELFFLHWDYT